MNSTVYIPPESILYVFLQNTSLCVNTEDDNNKKQVTISFSTYNGQTVNMFPVLTYVNLQSSAGAVGRLSPSNVVMVTVFIEFSLMFG